MKIVYLFKALLFFILFSFCIDFNFLCSLNQEKRHQEPTCTGLALLCEIEYLVLQFPSLLQQLPIIKMNELEIQNQFCFGIRKMEKFLPPIMSTSPNQCHKIGFYSKNYGKKRYDMLIKEIQNSETQRIPGKNIN